MAANNRTATTTQIRNMYSEGMSYLNTSFFNNSLSLKFYPFQSRDNTGRSHYDMNNGQVTTINYDLTYALYSACKEILEGKADNLLLTLPCNGATLTLDHKSTPNSIDTILSINKNNITIPFKFDTISEQITVNGNQQTKIIPAGLGAFKMTLEGFLTGINSDRHLDKLTEDYVKLQQNNNQGNNNYNNKSNYNKGNYKKNYNKGNYNNNYNNNQQTPVQTQDMSTYNIPF